MHHSGKYVFRHIHLYPHPLICLCETNSSRCIFGQRIMMLGAGTSASLACWKTMLILSHSYLMHGWQCSEKNCVPLCNVSHSSVVLWLYIFQSDDSGNNNCFLVGGIQMCKQINSNIFFVLLQDNVQMHQGSETNLWTTPYPSILQLRVYIPQEAFDK